MNKSINIIIISLGTRIVYNEFKQTVLKLQRQFEKGACQ